MCNDCLQTKALTDFASDIRNPTGYNVRCRACQSTRSKKHYADNQRVYYERNLRRKLQLREEVQALKESAPCIDCQKYWPYYVMHYDHITDNKVDGVSRLIGTNRSRESVMAEIAKCELVCGNCHAVRTHTRRTQCLLV